MVSAALPSWLRVSYSQVPEGYPEVVTSPWLFKAAKNAKRALNRLNGKDRHASYKRMEMASRLAAKEEAANMTSCVGSDESFDDDCPPEDSKDSASSSGKLVPDVSFDTSSSGLGEGDPAQSTTDGEAVSGKSPERRRRHPHPHWSKRVVPSLPVFQETPEYMWPDLYKAVEKGKARSCCEIPVQVLMWPPPCGMPI